MRHLCDNMLLNVIWSKKITFKTIFDTIAL